MGSSEIFVVVMITAVVMVLAAIYAAEETAETEYWLRLFVLSELITEEKGTPLIEDCLEIKRILIATLNTAKK